MNAQWSPAPAPALAPAAAASGDATCSRSVCTLQCQARLRPSSARGVVLLVLTAGTVLAFTVQMIAFGAISAELARLDITVDGVNGSAAASATLAALDVRLRAAVWQRELAMMLGGAAGASGSRIGVRGVTGEPNPSLEYNGSAFHLGHQWVLRLAERTGLVVQQAGSAVPLRAAAASRLLDAAASDAIQLRSGAAVVLLGTNVSDFLAESQRPDKSGSVVTVVLVTRLFDGDHVGTSGGWTIGASRQTQRRHLIRGLLVATLLSLLLMLMGDTIVYRMTLVSVRKRWQQMDVLRGAAATLELEALTLLRLSSGHRAENLRDALLAAELQRFDATFLGVVERLANLRKHLPQIVLHTQGTLSELLTVQALDVVDATELEFGSVAFAAGSGLGAGGRSPASSDTIDGSPSCLRLGGSGAGAVANDSDLGAPPLPSLYDAMAPAHSHGCSPEGSPSASRNPLAPRTGSVLGGVQRVVLDMVGPSDSRCFMILKKATFVVCRLFPPPALEDDLAALHRVAHSFYSLVSSIAAQFDGVVHSHSLVEIVLVWNAFRPYPFHEARGALCALHVASSMGIVEENPAIESGSTLRWCLAVNTGVVVVSQSGSARKMAPCIIGDALVMAQRVAQLGPSLQSNVIVMEHTHVVARSQVFSIPIDIIGDDAWRITLFDLKGRQEDHRNVDRTRYVEAFSLLSRHMFAEAEAKLFTEAFAEPQARRLLRLSRLLASIPNITNTVPNPYYRQAPAWSFNEVEADEIDIRAVVLAGRADEGSSNSSNAPTSWLSPTTSSLLTGPQRRSVRRPSILPQEHLRCEIERRRCEQQQEQDQRNRPASVATQSSNVVSPHDSTCGSLSCNGDRQTSETFAAPAVASVPTPEEENAVGVIGRGLSWRREGSAAVRAGDSPAPGTGATPSRPVVSPLHPTIIATAAAASSGSTDWSSVTGAAVAETPLGDARAARQVLGPEPADTWYDRKGHQWRQSTKRLGEGTFGAVYLGMSEGGELVAIKELPLPEGGDTERSQRNIDNVLTEVATLSALRHENVVRYYSSALVGSRLLIAMEFISGGTLAQLLWRFGALPSLSIRRYAKDILEGLRFLHSRSIVHRDISPNNVLVTVDGTCKLTDFGASVSITQLALMSDICGTPPFMAPEACRGAATTASDVWSFGVVAAFMFFGRLPYEPAVVADIPAFLHRLATDESFGPQLPAVSRITESERSFVTLCLTRDEAARPTVTELLAHPYFMN